MWFDGSWPHPQPTQGGYLAQAWPLSVVQASQGHSDWFTEGHIIFAWPMRISPETLLKLLKRGAPGTDMGISTEDK